MKKKHQINKNEKRNNDLQQNIKKSGGWALMEMEAGWWKATETVRKRGRRKEWQWWGTKKSAEESRVVYNISSSNSSGGEERDAEEEKQTGKIKEVISSPSAENCLCLTCSRVAQVADQVPTKNPWSCRCQRKFLFLLQPSLAFFFGRFEKFRVESTAPTFRAAYTSVRRSVCRLCIQGKLMLTTMWYNLLMYSIRGLLRPGVSNLWCWKSHLCQSFTDQN